MNYVLNKKTVEHLQTLRDLYENELEIKWGLEAMMAQECDQAKKKMLTAQHQAAKIRLLAYDGARTEMVGGPVIQETLCELANPSICEKLAGRSSRFYPCFEDEKQ